MRATLLRIGLALTAVLAIAGIAAGCGSSSDESSTTSTAAGATGATGPSASSANPTATPGIDLQEDAKIAALVPSDIKSKGTLTVAADATYAPDEFIAEDGKTVIGMDPDLMKAAGQLMGLDVDVQNAGFDSIIPGLAAGKYDVGASSFTINKEREKTVDFVSYLTAGESFYVKADGGPDVKTLDDLCGLTVAAERGTVEADDATAQSKTCEKNGDDAVKVTVFPDQNGVNLALSSDRADVAMADTPVAGYYVEKSDGQFKLSGKSFGNAPYGLAFPKDGGLDKPFLAAIQKLMDNGTYAKILKYWGVDSTAIENPSINPTDVPAS